LNFRPFQEKDTYGNEVSRLGRPLPVEYLLLDVPASTPVTPTYTFNSDPAKQPFPVENRLLDGDIQDFNALNQYLSQFNSNEFFTAINDFHLLLYIATMDMLPMKEYMGAVAEGPQEQGRRRRRGVVEQRALGHHRTADSGQFAAPVEVSSARDLCRFKSVFVGAGRAA
jgi:hypothetical protein